MRARIVPRGLGAQSSPPRPPMSASMVAQKGPRDDLGEIQHPEPAQRRCGLRFGHLSLNGWNRRDEERNTSSHRLRHELNSIRSLHESTTFSGGMLPYLAPSDIPQTGRRGTRRSIRSPVAASPLSPYRSALHSSGSLELCSPKRPLRLRRSNRTKADRPQCSPWPWAAQPAAARRMPEAIIEMSRECQEEKEISRQRAISPGMIFRLFLSLCKF